MTQVGRRQLRMEDDNLIVGAGRYVDDIRLPGMLHVVLVRSSMASAGLRKVDASTAKNSPGVVAVFTAADLPEQAKILPDGHPSPLMKFHRGPQVLVDDCVRYVGEPIAAVVATDAYLAEDAAELVEIEYEPRQAVVDPQRAMDPDSPLVHDGIQANVGTRIAVTKGDVVRAFASAPVIVRQRLEVHRGAGNAMETRGIVAHWNPAARRMMVWNVSQVPYVHRKVIAEALGLPERAVQVLNGDIGGGFGYKGLLYVEDVLIPFIAKELDCPVKWIEDRREHLIASYHERSQFHDLEMALDNDGMLIGVRGHFVHDHGAYSPWGPTIPLLTVVNIPGPYKVPHYNVEAIVVYTNCVPVAPVRGAGRPQAVYAMERLLDAAARELKMDPIELRRKNLIQGHEYPFDVGFVSRDGTRRVYDSGNLPALLDKALGLIDYEAQRKKQAELRKQGRYIGVGVACAVEESGLGPYEEVVIDMELDGTVTVRMGTPSHGQGQRTVFAQIVADELAVPFEDVTVLTGDTDNVKYSIGTFASRAGIVTGSAVLNGAKELRERLLRFGATILQADPADLTLEDRAVRSKSDPSKSIAYSEIVHTAVGHSGRPLTLRDFGPGMTARSSFSPPTNVFPTGSHAAVVEVDIRTGKVDILNYAAVEDFGNVINPLIVDGQVIGGVAHGIGNTFLERVKYDEEGQILTGTFADYLMPTTMDMPKIDLGYVATPCPLNPLGMKGAGQGGTIPVAAVLSAAVENALEPLGVRLAHVPFSESELLGMIQSKGAQQ
jgi:aerobic carbon-monoxide dehydrogenase large subunit